MKIKMKGWIATLLAVVTVFSFGLSACKNDDSSGASNPNEKDAIYVEGENGNYYVKEDKETDAAPVKPAKDVENHKITDVLHKVNVQASNRTLVNNGKTDYKIVVDGGNSEQRRAANYFVQQFNNATGVILDIVEAPSVTYTAESKYIVFGARSWFDAAGLQMPTDDLGFSGYYIKSHGNTVFAETIHDYGWQYATLALLREIVGFNIYAYDTVVFTKDGATLPTMEITERPDFELYIEGNNTADGYGMGFMNYQTLFTGPNSTASHNSLDWFDFNANRDDPLRGKWFADSMDQLCYTAHGDADAYEAMLQYGYEKLLGLIKANPSTMNFGLSIQDNGSACSCENCFEVYKKYNGNYVAPVIQFLNALTERADAYLTEEAKTNGTEKRSFRMTFLAYMKMETAPAIKVDGVYVPIDESVVCNDMVCVWIAPIKANYTKSFYDPVNSGAAENIKAWRACCKNIYMWIYETNFRNYLYPYNTWDSTLETIRFMKENNIVFMFPQAQYDQGSNITAFARIREYIHSKAYFDVNLNYADLLDDFFANYFKDASEPMRNYFDEMVAHLEYMAEENPGYFKGDCYEEIAAAGFWPYQMLKKWMGYIDQAYAAIKKYKMSDPKLYETLVNHINLESMFPRYAILSFYGGKMEAATLQAERIKFKQDCDAFGILTDSEHGSFSSVWTRWGLQ